VTTPLSLRVLGFLLLLLLISAFLTIKADEIRESILQRSMNGLVELLSPAASDIPGNYTCSNSKDSTLTLTLFPDGRFRQTSTGFPENITIDGKWSHVRPVLSANGLLSEDYLILDGVIATVETPSQKQHALINTTSTSLSISIKSPALTLQKRRGEVRCEVIKPPLLTTRIYIGDESCYVKR